MSLTFDERIGLRRLISDAARERAREIEIAEAELEDFLVKVDSRFCGTRRGYQGLGCRCAECRAWNTASRKVYNANAAARQTGVVEGTLDVGVAPLTDSGSLGERGVASVIVRVRGQRSRMSPERVR